MLIQVIQHCFLFFSQIASCYEEYVPTHLKFFFRTEEYMASGSTVSAGLCAMGTNFDANDSNFGNISQLENYEHSISGPPFSGIMVHDVIEEHRKRYKNKSRDLSLNNYYVFPSANSIGPTTDQAKWYDMGNFQLAVNGCQAGIIGELWVEYAFTMIRRKQPEFPIGGSAIHIKLLADDATAASPLGLTPFTTGSVVSTGPAVSGVAPSSTLSVINMAGSLANYTGSTVGLNDASDATINLPNVSATWLVHMFWGGATAITSAPIVTASGGATNLAIFAPNGATTPTGFFSAAGTAASSVRVFTSTATAIPSVTTNSLVLTGLATMTDGNVDIFISRLPNNLITFSEEDEKLEEEVSELRDEVRGMREFLKKFKYLKTNDLGDSESDVDSLEECKEADLQKSVHISQTLAAKLMKAVGK